jgi:hypothetical protein
VQGAVEKYIEVGRCIAALQAAQREAGKLPPELLFQILDGAVREIAESQTEATGLLEYDIDQIFDSLRTRSDVPKEEIAKREYAYLPIFGYNEKRLTIHSLLAERPELFASVICHVFKPESGENREPSPERVARARAGYRLLTNFDVIPGLENDDIDQTVLEKWIQAVRRLAAEQDRVTMADEFIGHLLAHSPHGSDGAWPHEKISAVIEQVSSNVVERGVAIERSNMRGVTTRGPFEGGEQERLLAVQTRDWAKARVAWPRTYAMLQHIANGWDKEGDLEDVSAKQDAMRYE